MRYSLAAATVLFFASAGTATAASAARAEVAASAVAETTDIVLGAQGPLTDDQLRKIIQYDRQRGHDHPISKALSDVLQVTVERGWVELHQVSIPDEGGNLIFAPLPDQAGYIFASTDEAIAYYFHLDPNLQLVAAAIDKSHQAPIAMPGDVRERFLPRTLAHWARFADRIKDDGQQDPALKAR